LTIAVILLRKAKAALVTDSVKVKQRSCPQLRADGVTVKKVTQAQSKSIAKFFSKGLWRIRFGLYL
jgi:hypothetical protein